ncbi:hypothetical protein H7I53_18120 [Mycolicibacterium pulveris]|uniref:Uncharacterized protein n=1 Tax=Mycolicibacterium pulveris TaxID=36813 RepID=A0A7I7UBT6_MYCPV|nr:hypothetical protein [Mycolicibacterium pulveris]MCV6982132.1 hypothetical protein [Mycolicibacterium pulveris]BBY78914.1 hypothetical protein MPUL_00720 [Mycolicibacterium pulveris]
MPDRWPLRYRIAHRLHCQVNRLHRYAGTRATWWLARSLVPELVAEVERLRQQRTIETVEELVRFEFPDIWTHVTQRWPTSTPFTQACKVAEEAGEVVGAVIKQREGRRTEEAVLDELADTVIAAISAIQARSDSAEQVVLDRWVQVRSR